MPSFFESPTTEHPLPPSRCAIYTRQSRKSEAALSSCEAQEIVCRDLADAHGWHVSGVFHDEGQSSETLKRPGLKQLLADFEEDRFDRLIVYSLDRLTRRLYDLNELLGILDRLQVPLTVATDPNFGTSAASQLVTNVVAAASEFQMELTRERLAESRAALKSKGRRVAGRVAFGYRADPVSKQLVVDSECAEIVKQIFVMAADGMRPREIAETANEEKWRDKKSETGEWTPRRILKMLSNPVYVGRIRNGEDTLPGQHQAIVTDELYEAANESIRSRRSRTPGRNIRSRRRPLLSGKVVCGMCNRPMVQSTSNYRNFIYGYYRCRSHAGGTAPCRGSGIGAYELEEFVRTALHESDDQCDEDETMLPNEFACRWQELNVDVQRDLLPDVIETVHLDIARGKAKIKLTSDAVKAVVAAYEITVVGES